MEDGRVLKGFSYPFVAKYNNAGGNVTYTGGMPLARGVDIKLNVETTDDNKFYANNVVAESEAGEFKSGTAESTVDGMHPVAERFVLGLPEPVEVAFGESQKVNVTKYGSVAKAPYVGYGFVAWYQSDGVDIYVPILLTKAKFRQPNFEAKTREENTSWQTQNLTADLHRDDSEDKSWKWIAADQTTEAAAVAILKGILNVADAEA